MIDIFLIVSLSICGLLITLKEFGIMDLYETHRLPWMPGQHCYFCLGHHISLAIFVAVWLFGGPVAILFCSLAAAALINFIMNANR